MEELKENISKFLKNEPVITLATERGGQPMTHPVVYASDGPVVYFITSPTSRKVENISKNPQVAYSVYRNTSDWLQTYSVQMEGKAYLVPDGEEKQKALGLIMEKFPMMKDMGSDSDQALVKVEPGTCRLADYSKGFGHVDIIEY